MVGQGERMGLERIGWIGSSIRESPSIYTFVLSIPCLWCFMCSGRVSNKGKTGNAL